MSEPYVLAGEWDGGRVLVGGLALPGLSGPGPGGPSGQAEGRMFAEIALGLVRRACREEDLQVVIRSAAREEGYAVSLLFTGQGDRQGEQDRLAAIVDGGVALLERWQASALDRAALERTLDLDPSWEVARLTRPAEPLRMPQKDIPALVGTNPDTGAWYPLICRDRFVFDVGLFRPAVPDLDRKVREVAVASEVLCRHLDDADRKRALQDNMAAGEMVRAQGVYAASAMTLACSGAEALTSEIRAFRHPLKGEVVGRAELPEGIPAGELRWAVLDYSEETEGLRAVEPDLRRPLELACGLCFHWGDWRRARRRMDPLDYLLGRVEMFEQRVTHRLDEVREALELAKVKLPSSLGQARLITEKIVKHHYGKHFPNRKKPPPLHDMIEELQGKIPNPVFSLMHTVRTFGNLGAHDTDFPVGVQHLGVVLEALCLLVEWHLAEESRGA